MLSSICAIVPGAVTPAADRRRQKKKQEERRENEVRFEGREEEDDRMRVGWEERAMRGSGVEGEGSSERTEKNKWERGRG